MDDLLREFLTESAESLAVLDLELVKLEQNPNNPDLLGNIFRCMHTIKGTCGFLGLPRLESVAHASENVLGKVRDKKLEATPEAITLVLESLDSIKTLIDHLSQHGTEPEGDDKDLIARLNFFADNGRLMGAGDTAPAAHGHAAPAAPVAAAANGAAAPAANGADTGGDFSSFFKGDDDLNALL